MVTDERTERASGVLDGVDATGSFHRWHVGAHPRVVAAMATAVVAAGGLVLAMRGPGHGSDGSGVAPTSAATVGSSVASSTAVTARREATYRWKDVPLVLVVSTADEQPAPRPPAGVPADCNGQTQQPKVTLATVASFTSALSPPTVRSGQQVWAVLCFDIPRSAAGEAAGTLPELVPDGDLIRLYGLDGQWLFTTHTPPGDVTSSTDGAMTSSPP